MVWKWMDSLLACLASVTWIGLRTLHLLPFRRRSVKVAWSDEPLIKNSAREFPVLGFPRETESLCPQCVQKLRAEILSGQRDWQVLKDPALPGLIKARLFEEEGKIWMEKTCPEHGTIRECISIMPALTRRLERLHPGRDFRLAPSSLHDHGRCSLRYGRGAVYTIDLTNRCNMRCSPCFMAAGRQVVHEPSWDEIRKILDAAAAARPRRQMSIQFSGGEPTLVPHFLEAIRYAKQLGFFSVQVATNGIRFAREPEFAKAAAEAGLKFAYLQFDGPSNESMQFRGVANLFEIKQRAIDNLAACHIPTALVVTVVRGQNDHLLKEIYEFTLRNIEKIHTIAVQPIAFAGRGEELSEQQRADMRYTLSHLVMDFKEQLGFLEPLRDWVPLSLSGPFSDLVDLLHAAEAQWGAMRCSCHPDCGAGTFVMVDMQTKESTPVLKFFNLERFMADVRHINDWAYGPRITKLLALLALVRNFRPSQAPKLMGLLDFLRQVDSHMGGNITGNRQKRFRWGMLAILSMWFQDLWNFDLQRTQMCAVPYGTQMGEFSFCAYNSGPGWRYILEHLHQTSKAASSAVPELYTQGKPIPLPAGSPPARKSDVGFCCPS